MIKLPRIPDHLNFQWPYLPHQLRARDIEVAKAVLEAAAKVCDEVGEDADSARRKAFLTPGGSLLYEGQWGGAVNCAVSIRALEISHD